MSLWSDSPDITCPSCGNEFHQSDYFEIKLGAEVTCNSCGKVLTMVDESFAAVMGMGGNE